MMQRIQLVGAALTLAAMTASTVEAKSKAKLPKVTGGGVVQNFNSGGPPQFTQLSLNAQATDQGVEVEDFLGSPLTLDYPAKGQVQVKNVSAEDPDTTLTQFHGEVVCIASLGTSEEVDGDDPNDDFEADPAGIVWEIRFLVTKAKVDGEEVDVPDGFYGSVYIQDGGRNDFADESFANPFNPECATNTQFGLEPVIHGNYTVH